MAGANEAEQTPRGAEQTPPKPETATEQASAPATEPATEQTPEPATEQAPEQAPEQTEQAPGFGERGRMRRRARFLRKARELAYRDLGGLVFDLHRFGQRNDQLVLAKLATLRQIDTELRELEQALRDRRPVTVLREVGIAACPRCAAIHGSDDRFCPGCGLAFDTRADRPISTAPVSPQAQAPAPTSQAPVTAQAPTTAVTTPATAQLTSQASLRPAPSNQPPAAAPTPPIGRPEPSKTTPALPVKPTAAPVAAKPVSPPVSPPAAPERTEPDRAAPERTEPEKTEPDRAEEDEPTQILRPPAAGT